MSTLSLEGTLVDNTGQLQCAITGAIVSLASRVSMPVDSAGKSLMSEDVAQARLWLCGIAREATTGYVLFHASNAIVAYAGGLPVTAGGALAVDIGGAAGGTYCAGVSFTAAGRVRADNGLS